MNGDENFAQEAYDSQKADYENARMDEAYEDKQRTAE